MECVVQDRAGKVVGICIHRGDFIQYDKEAPAPTPAI